MGSAELHLSNFTNLFARVRAAVSHLDFVPKIHSVTIAHTDFSAPGSTAGNPCLAAVGSSYIQSGRVRLSLQGSESLKQILKLLQEGLNNRPSSRHPPARLSGSSAAPEKWIE